MTKEDEIEELEAKNDIPKTEEEPSDKFRKQEEHTVEDVEHIFQFPGTRAAQAILDNPKGPLNTFPDVVYHSRLTDSVIVIPKLNWDYRDEHEGYREVMVLADNFLGRIFS